MSTRRLLLALSLSTWSVAVVASCGDKDDDDDDVDSGQADGEDGDDGTDGTSGGLECAAQQIGGALGEAVATGNTSSDSDDYDFCSSGGGGSTDSGDWSSGGGKDTTVSWTAPSAGRFTATTYGSDFDTMLTVLRGACDGSATECNDDRGGLQSVVVFQADAGEEIVFVVNGYSDGDEGDWQLNVFEGELDDTGWGGDSGHWYGDSGDSGWWDDGPDAEPGDPVMGSLISTDWTSGATLGSWTASGVVVSCSHCTLAFDADFTGTTEMNATIEFVDVGSWDYVYADGEYWGSGGVSSSSAWVYSYYPDRTDSYYYGRFEF